MHIKPCKDPSKTQKTTKIPKKAQKCYYTFKKLRDPYKCQENSPKAQKSLEKHKKTLKIPSKTS